MLSEPRTVPVYPRLTKYLLSQRLRLPALHPLFKDYVPMLKICLAYVIGRNYFACRYSSPRPRYHVYILLSYRASSSVSFQWLHTNLNNRFDGIMVSYLKTLSFSDDFIAEMRGICVVTGLMGTAIAAPLEKKIGSVRAGNWSIW